MRTEIADNARSILSIASERGPGLDDVTETERLVGGWG